MSQKTLRLAATLAVGVMGVSAPSAHAATQAHNVAASTPAVAPQRAAAESGFSVMRRTAGEALAMVSPSAGELWVAERGADGKVLLEHLRRGRWTSATLDVPASDDVKLATEGGQSALVVDGRLFLEDGGDWDEVLLPKAAGSRVRAVSVALGESEDVYVGAVGKVRGEGLVYRLVGRRWASLGNPGVARANLAVLTPIDMRVVSGELLVRWREVATSVIQEFVTRKDEAGWERLFGFWPLSDTYNSRATINAWLVRSVERQFMLGFQPNEYLRMPQRWCLRWSAPLQDSCATTAPVGAADLRADGSTVIGGISGYFFVLRGPDGYERQLDGSVGDGAFIVEAEPGTNVTWALTHSGGATVLQRYRG